MPKERYVWRGRRRQKLRALHRVLDRTLNKKDVHFLTQYRIFVDPAANFFTLLSRVAVLLTLKETIPKAPAVTP
jgi:hypothetical protein